MKKFMLTNIILLSVVLLSSFTSADLNSFDSNIIGTWDYSVPNAPIEYQKGQLILEKKEGELSGYTMTGEFKNVLIKPNLKGNNLTFTMYIEDTDVSFDLHFESKNFKGTVVYSEGILDITGVKKE